MDNDWDKPLLDAMTERELRMMLHQARLREERDQALIHNLVVGRRLLLFSLSATFTINVVLFLGMLRHMKALH